MNTGLISVIIPVYNGEKYIESTVDRINESTLLPSEIILVNDGSKDNSLTKCLSLKEKYHNVKVVDKENVLYAYRSKRIVSIVANELHMRGRAEYYKKIKQMLLDEKYRGRLVKIMRNFVPVIKAYNFEDYYWKKGSHLWPLFRG